MKIISKYKDYYDYLKGVYGEDPRLVLDRRTDKMYPLETFSTKNIPFYICNKYINGFLHKGKTYFGKDVMDAFPKYAEKKFDEKLKLYYYRLIDFPDAYSNMKHNYGKFYENFRDISITPYNNENERFNCPILLCTGSGESNLYYIKFPKLSDYNIGKVYSPHDIWVDLSAWIGSRIIEPDVPIGDDKLRIVSHGFDLKTSFRNTK